MKGREGGGDTASQSLKEVKTRSRRKIKCCTAAIRNALLSSISYGEHGEKNSRTISKPVPTERVLPVIETRKRFRSSLHRYYCTINIDNGNLENHSVTAAGNKRMAQTFAPAAFLSIPSASPLLGIPSGQL